MLGLDVRAFSPAKLAAVVHDLPHWTASEDNLAIWRKCKFSSFPEAMAFIVRVGFAAETMNHHPEWSNVFDTVMIRLTTHDCGGVSPRDVDMARLIDRLLALSPEERFSSAETRTARP